MRESMAEKDIVVPNDEDIILAETSGKQLAVYIRSTKEPVIKLMKEGRGGDVLTIPASALHLLAVILHQMALGNAVTIMPVHAELTTQQAADILNVSRPFLVNLLEEGAIPFRRVGTRRRVLARDVLRYKQDIDERRLKVLEELAADAQKNNMGY